MSPLETYLMNVRKRLPRKDRDDVVQELRAALLERLDRKEAEWGRPLTADEQHTIVRGFGHPYVVAARYWNGRGLLGGPFTLYYRSTLLWGVVVTLLVHVGLALYRATYMTPPDAAIARTIPGLVFAITTVFVITTFVFLLLDTTRARVRREA